MTYWVLYLLVATHGAAMEGYFKFTEIGRYRTYEECQSHITTSPYMYCKESHE